MTNLFKILSFFIILFSFVLESFAIDAPTNLKADSSNNSSVNLSWSTVDEALFYYVYYSKQSWLEIGYDLYTDVIESNSTVISDLDIDSTYYFTVVALDENGEESAYSNEIVIDVVEWDTINQNDFALESIDVAAYNKLKLIFNSNLDNSENTIREFKITNKKDDLDIFDVVSTEIDEENNNILELTLDRDTEIWNKYEFVIIAITSEEWKNIESWIDNNITFDVVEIIEPIVKPVIEEVIVEEEVVDLNSASEEVSWPSWENIEASDVENTTLVLAEKNETLPKTWAEHVLMLILSIILWALIFVFNYKKI